MTERAIDASQPMLQTVSYGHKPSKLTISLCLVGILAGGITGELLRESLTTSFRQHAMFTQLLNSPEVENALASKKAQSAATNEMVQVSGPWVKDLCWQDGHVSYFVFTDGSFLFDATRPPTWAYPLVLLFPVLGFLVPWGAMKIRRRFARIVSRSDS